MQEENIQVLLRACNPQCSTELPKSVQWEADPSPAWVEGLRNVFLQLDEISRTRITGWTWSVIKCSNCQERHVLGKVCKQPTNASNSQWCLRPLTAVSLSVIISLLSAVSVSSSWPMLHDVLVLWSQIAGLKLDWCAEWPYSCPMSYVLCWYVTSRHCVRALGLSSVHCHCSCWEPCDSAEALWLFLLQSVARPQSATLTIPSTLFLLVTWCMTHMEVRFAVS